MTVGICGRRSAIAEAFAEMIDESQICAQLDEIPDHLDRYLICSGYLVGRSATEMALYDAAETFLANCFLITRMCERIFAANDAARICIIGSHSAYAGSHDTAYACAKAGLHRYVETKELHGEQQLVALSPHVIADAGMTQRRRDLAATMQRGERTRLGRWITSAEVAATAKWALYDAPLFLTNTVIRISGGKA